MIRAVFLDLDDTIYPEYQFVISGFRAVSDYLSAKENSPSNEFFNILKADFDCGLRKRNFDVLIKKAGLDDEMLDRLMDVYRGHIPVLAAFTDVAYILQDLKCRYKLALITDGYPATQRNKIVALDIGNYFDNIVINDISKGESKMSPEPFRKILEMLRIRPDEAIYVGDNPIKDFMGSKIAGLHTARIIRENGEYSHIHCNNPYKADYEISSLIELPVVIFDIDRNSIGE